jgi:hypothetical protein
MFNAKIFERNACTIQCNDEQQINLIGAIMGHNQQYTCHAPTYIRAEKVEKTFKTNEARTDD